MINGKEVRKTFRSRELAELELIKLEARKREEEKREPINDDSPLRFQIEQHLKQYGKHETTTYVLDLIYKLAG